MSTVRITIARERPLETACTPIAVAYDVTIPLEGTFPPGPYLLRVNHVETPFTTD